jgi:hypothetical protein
MILCKLLSLQKTEDGVSLVASGLTSGLASGLTSGLASGLASVPVAAPVAGVDVVAAPVAAPVAGVVVDVFLFNLSFGAGFGVDELVKKITDTIIEITIIKHTTPMIINLYLSKDSISEGAAGTETDDETDGVDIDILSTGVGG